MTGVRGIHVVTHLVVVVVEGGQLFDCESQVMRLAYLSSPASGWQHPT